MILHVFILMYFHLEHISTLLHFDLIPLSGQPNSPEWRQRHQRLRVPWRPSLSLLKFDHAGRNRGPSMVLSHSCQWNHLNVPCLLDIKGTSTLIIWENLTLKKCPEHTRGFCRFSVHLVIVARIYSSYHTVGEDQLLFPRNFLHRYSLTFDTAGSPTSPRTPRTVRMPCPADLLTSLKQVAWHGLGSMELWFS